MALDQNGLCGCGCGEKLDHAREGTIDEHLRALGLQGTNALENRSIWRKPCSDAKTYKQDLPAIAKAKRIEKKQDPLLRKPSRLQGRGFQKPKDGYKWPSRKFPGKRETP